MNNLMVLASVFFFSLNSFAVDCPQFRLLPSDSPQKSPFRSLEVHKDCVASKVLICPTGQRIVNDEISLDNKVKIIRGICYKTGDPRVKALLGDRRIKVPGSDQAIPITKEELLENSDPTVAELRKAALAKGVPEVIFERALAHYLDMKKLGKTARNCFMAGDLTSPGQGKTWTLCLPSVVTEAPTYWGSGRGPGCQAHVYTNKGSTCARFFGNKPGYCLSSGGRYITGEVSYETGTARQFADLLGLDKDQNDNTKERNIGIHQTSNEEGSKDYVGNVDPETYSQGCVTVPFRGAKHQDMSEYSAESSQGGMVVYMYPSRQDILDFRQNGSAAYWNASCAKEIGEPGWLGTKDTAAPSMHSMTGGAGEGNLKARQPSAAETSLQGRR